MTRNTPPIGTRHERATSRRSQGKMVVFGAKQIRRIWHEEQWFFSVVDIIAALTDSDNPRNYWNMMKAAREKQSEVQLSTFCVQLKLTSSDGKTYKTDCVNTEAAFRIIQSIPSPKAEPFKRWLAKVGLRAHPRDRKPRTGPAADAGTLPAKGVSGRLDRKTRPLHRRPRRTDRRVEEARDRKSRTSSPSSPPKSPKPRSASPRRNTRSSRASSAKTSATT